MSLRWRLSFSLVALVALSLGASTAWLYLRTRQGFERDFERDVAAVRAAVGERFQRDADRLRARLEALSGDPRLTEVLEDAERGRLASDPKVARRATEIVDVLCRSAGLDALWLLTREEPMRVLLAGHTSVESAIPSGTLRIARSPKDHGIALESVRRAGRPATVPALEVAVSRGAFVLVAGRVMGREVAHDLRPGAVSADVAIVDPAGKIVAATFDGEPPGGVRSAEVPLEPAASGFKVRVLVSEARLHDQLLTLREATLVGAGTAVVLAVALALLIAVRLSRPLRALSAAARRIAAGERDVVLARRSDEIGAVNAAFASMAEELLQSETRLRQAERIAAWQDIARELAHEIKNPLTPIQMAVETLKRTYERRPERFAEIFPESTATVLEEVERLKHIVSEFSGFARLPASEPRPGDLNEVVRRCVQLYQETCASVIQVRLGEGVNPALIDPDRIAQLVQNLVKNAIEATTPAPSAEGSTPDETRVPEIVVSTERIDGRWVRLVVSDNGPGIRPEDQSRVFTPYFTRRTGGSGLGLAVVSRIAAEHGGNVELTSVFGEGTTFTVLLRKPRD